MLKYWWQYTRTTEEKIYHVDAYPWAVAGPGVLRGTLTNNCWYSREDICSRLQGGHIQLTQVNSHHQTHLHKSVLLLKFKEKKTHLSPTYCPSWANCASAQAVSIVPLTAHMRLIIWKNFRANPSDCPSGWNEPPRSRHWVTYTLIGFT